MYYLLTFAVYTIVTPKRMFLIVTYVLELLEQPNFVIGSKS